MTLVAKDPVSKVVVYVVTVDAEDQGAYCIPRAVKLGNSGKRKWICRRRK